MGFNFTTPKLKGLKITPSEQKRYREKSATKKDKREEEIKD